MTDMKPRRLIKEALKSERPMASGFAILRLETDGKTDKALIDALLDVYLHVTFPNRKSTFKEFIQDTTERRCRVACKQN